MAESMAAQLFAPEIASGAGPYAVPGTVFSTGLRVPRLVREGHAHPHLDLSSVAAVVEGWRAAILTRTNGLPDRVRALISGHRPDGRPSGERHLAFLPLTSVGHGRADGRLRGMGFVLPAGVAPDEQLLILSAIGGVRRLLLGRLGAWTAVSRRPETSEWHLRPCAWTAARGSRALDCGGKMSQKITRHRTSVFRTPQPPGTHLPGRRSRATFVRIPVARGRAGRAPRGAAPALRSRDASRALVVARPLRHR